MCNIGNWKCQHCQDTGELGGLGALDCGFCTASNERAELQRWVQAQPRMVESDLIWSVYKFAKQQR